MRLLRAFNSRNAWGGVLLDAARGNAHTLNSVIGLIVSLPDRLAAVAKAPMYVCCMFDDDEDSCYYSVDMSASMFYGSIVIAALNLLTSTARVGVILFTLFV